MTLPSLDVFVGLITIYIVLALTVSALTAIITRLVVAPTLVTAGLDVSRSAAQAKTMIATR